MAADRCRIPGREGAAVGLPTIVDNDANVAAVAELTHGAARGEREVLLITLGTGVGGGIVTRGAVLRGAQVEVSVAEILVSNAGASLGKAELTSPSIQ